MSDIYFDIESEPKDEKDVIFPEFKANKNIKDEEKKKENIKQKRLDFMRDAQLNPFASRVCAIGYLDGESLKLPPRNFSEGDMLEAFLSISGNTRVRMIGYGIKLYDLEFIWKRCMINGLKVRSSIRTMSKRWVNWSDRFIDLMDVWGKDHNNKNVGLSYLAKNLGVGRPRNYEVEATTFYKYWKSDNQEDVDKATMYLSDDLREAKAIGERVL